MNEKYYEQNKEAYSERSKKDYTANKVKRQAQAKECYKANRSKFIASSKASRQRLIDEITELKKKPCLDCNQSFPTCVMDFDHKDPSQKIRQISVMTKRYGRDKVLEEITKCDLVCANCHRIRTDNRMKLEPAR